MSGNTQAPGPESSMTDRATVAGRGATHTQEHTDTQRSLQQASVALEVAYNRIRQVRRSLLQLSESLPNPDNLPRFSANHNEVRPGHEALLLSGDRSEGSTEMDREPASFVRYLTSGPPPSRSSVGIPSPEQSAILPETGESRGVIEPLQPRDNLDSILFHPVLPPNVLPPRFSRRDLGDMQQYFPRFSVNQDSAITLRGLRVAAREASAREGSDDMSAQSTEHDRLLREALEGDSVLSGNPQADGLIRATRNVDSRDARRAGASPSLPPSSPPSWRVPDPRRWRTRTDGRTYPRPTVGDASERFNSLSNMFDTAVLTPQIPRNVPRFPLSTDSPSLIPSSMTYEEYRLFQQYGRWDHNPSSNANLERTDEEFISWLFHGHERDVQPLRTPRNDPNSNSDAIRITRTTDTDVSPPENENSPPRRGWARLDPDGNEIPPSEEEELERSRTASRLQALQRARQNATANAGNNNGSRTVTGGRLLNNDGQGTLYNDISDLAHRRNRHRRHDREGRSSPLYIDPLPMPLSSMVFNPEAGNENPSLDIFVPKNACLAGR